MAVLNGIQRVLSWVQKPTAINALAVIILVLYGVALAVYRLYFSPLAKFPGPKLAALTQWYETYYEIIKGKGGHFTFQIKKLHEQYGMIGPLSFCPSSHLPSEGPIVRINPHELHIDDPEYYEIVYSTSQPCDKPTATQHRFNMGYSAFATPENDIHKRRRMAIAPFFAKRKILTYGPFIQGRIDRICERIRDEYAGKHRVLVLGDVFGSLTSDVITNLAFAKSYSFIEMPNFQSELGTAIKDMVYTTHWTTQFPWLVPMMNAIPNSVVGFLPPIFKTVLEFRGVSLLDAARQSHKVLNT